LVAIHHQMPRTRTHLGNDLMNFNEDWGQVHKQFHTILLEGCKNQRLKGLALSLRDSAEVYRRAGVRPSGSDTSRDVVEEHQRLLDTAVARDADGAVETLVQHIRTTTDYLLRVGTFY